MTHLGFGKASNCSKNNSSLKENPPVKVQFILENNISWHEEALEKIQTVR